MSTATLTAHACPAAPRTIDLRRLLHDLYVAPAKEPVFLRVPPLHFLMIDGAGDPERSLEFESAIDALYATAYTLRSALKKSAKPVDFPVMPLEGLWWSEGADHLKLNNKAGWNWTLMIVQPDVVTADLLANTIVEVEKRKSAAAARGIRLERLSEGTCVQILHVGPYAAEAPTIGRLNGYIRDQGFTRRGKHHEIYLGDPRRATPENLKTILRQPVD